MEEAFIAFLLADPVLKGLVGVNIALGWRTQGYLLPGLTLVRTDGKRDPLLAGGASGFVDGYLQADAWAGSAAEAKAVARALVRASQAMVSANTGGVIQGAFVEHESDEFEGEKPDRIFRTRLSLRVPYNEI